MKNKDKLEAISGIVITAFFGLMCILSLIGGFMGAPWHFYTAGICAMTAGIMWLIHKTDRHV